MSNEVQTSMLGVDQLAGALAKAQRAMKHAEKSRTNPHFKQKYATLADVIDACREPLADNDLSYVQKVSSEQGVVIVETMLMHKSGQSISATLTMPTRNDAQGIGSALTYARRYGLAAMVGIAPDDDDDGNSAGRSDERREEPRSQQRVTPQSDRGHSQAPVSGSTSGDMSSKQVDDAIAKVFKEIRGVRPEATAGELREAAGFPAKGSLTVDQRTVLLRSMEQTLKKLQQSLEGDGAPDDDDIPF